MPDIVLPESSRRQLAPDLAICAILNGMWQVSGAHGPIDRRAAVQNMIEYHESGFTTWDLADHYGPAEEFIGEFRERLLKSSEPASLERIQALTKWVPEPGRMPRQVVEQAVDRSLKRMRVERLDLLQFHWWDYQDLHYFDALEHLSRLRDQGKIRRLGLTNFDTERLQAICGQGFEIVSNQVQYSLIDRRPEARMAALCREKGIGLLTYGTLAGGLLSERYLGQPEPRRESLGTASLRKYRQMIDAWGTWPLFQELLRAVKAAADRRGASMANVAARYILDRPAVAGVIVGVRLGVADHRAENARVFDLSLAPEDVQEIDAVLAKGRDLMASIGDCGDEYRR